MDTAPPQVINTTQDTKPTKFNRREFLRRYRKLIIFVILVLVVAAELSYSVRTILMNNAQTNVPIPKIYPLSEGKLILVSSRKDYKIGEIVPVTVKIATGGNISDSTDLVLRFDPKILEAPSASFIRLGEIYADYPVADFDKNSGIVKISGTTPPRGIGFEGVGTFATLYFKAKSAGSTTVQAEFEKGSTADSNIVLTQSTKDILTEVINADIMIISGQINPSKESEKQMCSGYFQYCQTDNGVSGKQFCRSGAFDGTECVFDPKFTVSCSLCKDN
jgi:hypothetical protein